MGAVGAKKFTDYELSKLSDKDSKKPEYRELYETLPFIEAYAKHTDMRIAKDGPELAIGAKRDGKQDWDIHGKQQLEFLISKGLKPTSSLLDFGCGTGRLACQAVPYLNAHCYIGADISESAIDACRSKDWGQKMPIFSHCDGGWPVWRGTCDLIWSHSVITHLPPEVVRALFSSLESMIFGQFFFTYKQGEDNARTGLKQFAFSSKWLIKTAAQHGLKAESDPMVWPAGQRTMRVTRA